MAEEIKIKKKVAKRGDDGYKIVSVRMKDELIEKLDKLSADTNRSRNELINLLLDAAVDIVKIEGSVELAPLVSLADGIVDIVETGTTLKENGLEVFEDVAPISARLIVNTVSMKLKKDALDCLVGKMTKALNEGDK